MTLVVDGCFIRRHVFSLYIRWIEGCGQKQQCLSTTTTIMRNNGGNYYYDIMIGLSGTNGVRTPVTSPLEEY
eukprot:scaffold2747_cov104-Cylindrotheca_fusiformis.AAC.19